MKQVALALIALGLASCVTGTAPVAVTGSYQKVEFSGVKATPAERNCVKAWAALYDPAGFCKRSIVSKHCLTLERFVLTPRIVWGVASFWMTPVLIYSPVQPKLASAKLTTLPSDARLWSMMVVMKERFA